MRAFLPTLIALSIAATPASADTIWLKNGRRLEVEGARIENGAVLFVTHGVLVRLSADFVVRVRLDTDKNARPVAPARDTPKPSTPPPAPATFEPEPSVPLAAPSVVEPEPIAPVSAPAPVGPSQPAAVTAPSHGESAPAAPRMARRAAATPEPPVVKSSPAPRTRARSDAARPTIGRLNRAPFRAPPRTPPRALPKLPRTRPGMIDWSRPNPATRVYWEEQVSWLRDRIDKLETGSGPARELRAWHALERSLRAEARRLGIPSEWLRGAREGD